MTRLEQSRREWEREVRDVQHNVTPADELRTAQYLAKQSAKSSGALIPDLAHLIRFILGAILLGFSVVAFSSGIPHGAAVGLAAFAAGSYLEYGVFRSAFRSNH